jgi:hypothetical protein
MTVPDPGLCTSCLHKRQLGNNRGSVFYMCERGLLDPDWAKYPRLPVFRCTGYEEQKQDSWPEGRAGESR